MFKMQYGDLGEFESCFTFACPKFLSPCPPPIEPGSNYGRDAVKHQTQVFMDEVSDLMGIHEIVTNLPAF